ncbi:MAG: SRPBCC family protein [Reyranella sp.]|nr:SRPBCC family protein [Reyranella sp.]
MSEDAQFTHAHMVRFERLLPGPVERAWQVLTEASLLPGWYGEGHIEPRIGGAVTLMGGHIRGTVTQCLPPERLTYSWNVFNPGDEVSPYPESYLSLELKPAGGDTALTLTHLPVLERFVKLNAMGWHTYLDMVAAAVRGEPVAPRDAYMTRNAKTYGIDLANPLG